MQIAVAGMEHIGAAQRIFCFHGGDEPQHLAQALARDGAVHAVVIRRNASDRRKRRLAPGPEFQALRLVLRNAEIVGAGLLQHRGHARDFFLHLLRGAVGFTQQQRGRTQVVAGMHILLHQPGRDDAGGDHGGRGVARLLHVVEGGEDHPRRLRLRHQLDRDFRGHGEHALGPHDQGKQVVARRIERLIAEFDQLAVDGAGAHAHDVVHGEAVLEAVHTAGVLGHVAAYGAGDLRGGIRGVIQAVGRGRLGDG